MQPTVGHQSTTKWLSPLSCAIRLALSSPQTWQDLPNPRISPSTRNDTCMIIDSPLPPLNTGRTQSTPPKTPLPKPSQSGKIRATNLPSTPTFPMAGFSQHSTQSTPTSALQESKTSLNKPQFYNPAEEKTTGMNKLDKQTKCSRPGKPITTILLPQNAPLSPNACGTINTTSCTYSRNQTPGGASSTTPASPSGERTYSSTVIPELQQEASETNMDSNSTLQNNNNNNSFEDLQKRQQETAQKKADTIEYYDYYNDYYCGDTEPFQIHSPIPTSPPTTNPETQSNDTQQNNNSTNNKDKKKKKKEKRKIKNRKRKKKRERN